MLPLASHDPLSLSEFPPSRLRAAMCRGLVPPLDRKHNTGRHAGDTRPGQCWAAAAADTQRAVPRGKRGTSRRREALTRARQRETPLTRYPLLLGTARTPTLKNTAQKRGPWTAKGWPGPPPPSTHNQQAGDAAPGRRARGTTFQESKDERPDRSRRKTHRATLTPPCPRQNPPRAAGGAGDSRATAPPPPRYTGP